MFVFSLKSNSIVLFLKTKGMFSLTSLITMSLSKRLVMQLLVISVAFDCTIKFKSIGKSYLNSHEILLSINWKSMSFAIKKIEIVANTEGVSIARWYSEGGGPLVYKKILISTFKNFVELFLKIIQNQSRVRRAIYVRSFG